MKGIRRLAALTRYKPVAIAVKTIPLTRVSQQLWSPHEELRGYVTSAGAVR